MTLRVVIDTNIWIRILLRGRVTLPILTAFNEAQFQLIMSQPLLEELHLLKARIDAEQASRLEQQLQHRAVWVELQTVPPHCRDAKDLPVLATAIDGQASVIVSGDDDLRADEDLRQAMAAYGIDLLGVNSFLERLESQLGRSD
jgi:uncharacterized protein